MTLITGHDIVLGKAVDPDRVTIYPTLIVLGLSKRQVPVLNKNPYSEKSCPIIFPGPIVLGMLFIKAPSAMLLHFEISNKAAYKGFDHFFL